MSPILLLPSDVLLHIFDINASDGFWTKLSELSSSITAPHDPLSITFRTSHTCKAWQELLLDSPSVWGKLINLNSLDSRLDLQKELILRTRDAPLWVKGSELVVYPGTDAGRKNALLVPFVQKHWRRIHSLRLSLDKWESYEGLWAAVSQDAPYLRHLEIYNRQLHWENRICPSFEHLFRQQELFAGYAPLLHSFICALFPVNPSAPWIHRLVHFDSRAAHYPFSSPHEILRAVFRMTKLEELRLTQKIKITPQMEQLLEAPGAISSYNLREVVLNARARICQSILACVAAPERLQIVRLLVLQATFTDSQAVLGQFTNTITRSLAVSNLRLRSLQLKFSRRTILFHASSNIHHVELDKAVPNEVLFRLTTSPLLGLHLEMMPTFDLPPVSFVTHLSLDISNSLLAERPSKSLAELMKNFTSVTNISAPGDTITILLEHGVALFPALRVITQTDWEDISGDVIAEFGLQRSAYGYPPVQVVVAPVGVV